MKEGIITEYRSEGINFPPRPWLGKSEFSRACLVFIRMCVDVFLFSRERKAVYLACRIISIQGWMGFGGQVDPGEELSEAASRILKGDTGLEILPENFYFLCWVRCIYRDEMDQPRDSIAFQFSCEVKPEQINGIRLNPKEYNVQSGVRSFDKNRLIKERQELHPGVEDVFKLIFRS